MLVWMWRKRTPATLLVGGKIGIAAVENSTEVLQTTTNRVTVRSSSRTLHMDPKKTEMLI